MSLKEFKNSPQNTDEALVKRWFSDINLDVFVWEGPNDVERIEVLWDESDKKNLWVWQLGSEGKFYQIDEGDSDPRKNLSPLVKTEVEGDYNLLLAKIESASGDLPIALLTIFRTLA